MLALPSLLQEPVAWTAEEAEDAEAPGREGTVSTIDPVGV